MLFVDSGVNKVCCCCNVMVLYLRMIINLKNIYTNIFPKFMVRSLVFFLGGGGAGGGEFKQNHSSSLCYTEVQFW